MRDPGPRAPSRPPLGPRPLLSPGGFPDDPWRLPDCSKALQERREDTSSASRRPKMASRRAKGPSK
eukprot:1194031-Pyramimonas_sp.AAC.1